MGTAPCSDARKSNAGRHPSICGLYWAGQRRAQHSTHPIHPISVCIHRQSLYNRQCVPVLCVGMDGMYAHIFVSALPRDARLSVKRSPQPATQPATEQSIHQKRVFIHCPVPTNQSADSSPLPLQVGWAPVCVSIHVSTYLQFVFLGALGRVEWQVHAVLVWIPQELPVVGELRLHHTLKLLQHSCQRQGRVFI